MCCCSRTTRKNLAARSLGRFRTRMLAGTVITTTALLLASGPAGAVPIFIAGTDADDHGFVNASGNQDGWFFMQRVLENVAPDVINGNRTLIALGSDPNTQAFRAIQSAFNLSSLNAAGWSFVNINGASAITDFFNGVGAVNISNAGMVYLDSSTNVSGGITTAELNVVRDNRDRLNEFIGNGGGLFSQSNNYQWLTALLPAISVMTPGSTGLELTPEGQAALPGLTNQDLSAGPWHNYFTGFESSPLFRVAVDPSFTPARTVILAGNRGGTFTQPPPPPPGGGVIPEPGTYALLASGLLPLAGMVARRRRSSQD